MKPICRYSPMGIHSVSLIYTLLLNYSLGIASPIPTTSLFLLAADKRAPESDEESMIEMNDDPYSGQLEAFIADAEAAPRGRVLSTFEDAFKTYEFTWAIKEASECGGGITFTERAAE
jgi:hypothetical protein